jgi:hypothetical protein
MSEPIKLTLTGFDMVRLLMNAMTRGGAARVEVKRTKAGGYVYTTRACKGGDIRDFYDHLLDFEVDEDGITLLPEVPR